MQFRSSRWLGTTTLSLAVVACMVAAWLALPSPHNTSEAAVMATSLSQSVTREAAVALATAEQTDYQNWLDITSYVQGIHDENVRQWVAGVQEGEREAWLAAHPPPVQHLVTAPSSPAVVSNGGGGCASGGGVHAVPEYIVQRESGGNYCASNPSGACGAYQIMPGTWGGFGGYASACDAPPAVQDAKAATMALCNWNPPNYCAGG